jgi:Uma2 family endonuclease/predicted nucleotidyltransferase
VNQQYQLGDAEKRAVKDRLRERLAARPEVRFAYLHGSFLGADRFRDMDVAVSVDRGSLSAADPTTYELDLEAVLERGLGLPVHVRVVEDAPSSFRYAVTLGEELFVPHVTSRHLLLPAIIRLQTKRRAAASGRRTFVMGRPLPSANSKNPWGFCLIGAMDRDRSQHAEQVGELAYNPAMTTRSADYRETIEHLPEGALLVLQGVSWEEYERLLKDLVDRPGMRVTYDQGRLEIMSPSPEHEIYKEAVARMVYALCDELELNVEGLGSSTWKKKPDMKGTEPDTCFYLANAAGIIGKRQIDLTVDPPPDLVVEIDQTNESLSKFPIYAALMVPEIWRYDAKGHRTLMYELLHESYVEVAFSRAFPILTGDVIATFLEQSQTQGQRAALAAFRRWIRQHERHE